MIQFKGRTFPGILFFLAFGATGLAQSNRQPALSLKQEKIYIHFDRPYYAAGETIWFKAYLYSDGHPSLLSNEFFLELEDVNGRMISRKKYPLSGGSVSGNINLSDTLAQGYYLFKAITRTIASDDDQFHYEKTLFIFNSSPAPSKNPVQKKNISLLFFPESGHLIDRVKTQVAFKATDETGNPISVSGIIRSDSTNVITSFKSFHDGIGKMSFTPHLGDVLFAELEMNGNKYQFSLPGVDPEGVYLKVTDADSGKIFDITRSKKNNDQFDTVKLIVKQEHDTVFQTNLSFGNEQTISAFLKTQNLPSGILHFVVLNKDGVPLAERLSFINNHEFMLQPELLVVKRDSSKRAANIFELKFRDSIQKSFSISVTDFAAQEFPDKENICSRLFLTSDLRGYVYNPAYYFEKNDADHKRALDNLMLTHGWTRYNWQRATGMPITNKTSGHDYLITISGGLKEVNDNKPISGGNLNLQIFSEDSVFQSYDVAVDRNGQFSIDSLLFFGNARILYNYTSASGSKRRVNIYPDRDKDDAIFSRLATTNLVNAEGGQSANKIVFNERPASITNPFYDPKFKQLSTIVLKTKLKRPEDKMNERYASPLFRSSGKIILDNINSPSPDQSLDVVNYSLINIQTLSYDREANTFVNKKNFSLQTQKNWKVEVLIDEAVSGIDYAKEITMNKVAMIKFYEAGFVGVGTAAPGGALAIYLKKFDDEPAPATSDTKLFHYKGYTITQDFYHPDYSVSRTANSKPDNRLTLFWDPSNNDVRSDKIKFRFFNNDISGKLRIVVEGFDATGRLIWYEGNFGD